MADLVTLVREGQQNITDTEKFKEALMTVNNLAELNQVGKEDEPHAGMTCLHLVCSQGFIKYAAAMIDRASEL